MLRQPEPSESRRFDAPVVVPADTVVDRDEHLVTGTLLPMPGVDGFRSFSLRENARTPERENPASLAGAGSKRYVLDSDVSDKGGPDQRAYFDRLCALWYVLLTVGVLGDAPEQTGACEASKTMPRSCADQDDCLGIQSGVDMRTRVALAVLLASGLTSVGEMG